MRSPLRSAVASLTALAGAAALLLTPALAAPPASAASRAAPVRADDGARLMEVIPVRDRVIDLLIDSPALGQRAYVRLLTPKGWSRTANRSWPVLYLLHGCCADYRSWDNIGELERMVGDTQVLVAMPEAGQVGFYSNWWNKGKGGTPGWEKFHLTEVRQILERGFGAGRRRAVAGLSMGGFGALSYAARHPAMFRAAASYSGVIHTRYDEPAQRWLLGLVDRFAPDPLDLWGDPVKQASIWAAHNPYDLARGLRGQSVYISCGNGEPGPLDKPGAAFNKLEKDLGDQAVAFAARMRQLGHPHFTANLYGPGTHASGYWRRELHASFPMLMRGVGAE